jgi:hypothetical protein
VHVRPTVGDHGAAATQLGLGQRSRTIAGNGERGPGIGRGGREGREKRLGKCHCLTRRRRRVAVVSGGGQVRFVTRSRERTIEGEDSEGVRGGFPGISERQTSESRAGLEHLREETLGKFSTFQVLIPQPLQTLQSGFEIPNSQFQASFPTSKHSVISF